MRTASLLATCLVSACVLSGCGPDAAPKQLPEGVTADGYAQDLFDATNDTRLAEELPDLAWSDCAAGIALARAEALVGSTELTHAPLDDAMDACGASLALENLVQGAATPAQFVEAWMDSEGHRSNLLDPAPTSTGVGCVLLIGGKGSDAAGPGDTPQTILCSQVYLGQAE